MPQVLDQPYNNSVLVDGVINDKPIRASGLDGIEIDVAVINTLMQDKAIVVVPESNPVLSPQV